MRTDSSTEETSVIYTEDEFNLHEYFFLIFSAVFIIIMLCILSTFIFNRCVMKCCIFREQSVSRSSRQVIWSPCLSLPLQTTFRLVLFQQMSAEDYASLVRKHHEYIKTGTMTPCMRTKASHQASMGHNNDQRRFTLDQTQIIKCNDSTSTHMSLSDSVYLDKL